MKPGSPTPRTDSTNRLKRNSSSAVRLPAARIWIALLCAAAWSLSPATSAGGIKQGADNSPSPSPVAAPYETLRQDTAQLVLHADALLGEGAIWHPGRRSLLWVDIEGKALHEYIPVQKESPDMTDNDRHVLSSMETTGAQRSPTPFTSPATATSNVSPSPTTRQWHFEQMVSTVVPESDSTVVVALQNAIVRVNLHTGRQERLATIDDHNGLIRSNDGKCDPSGRLWIGTMAFAGTPGAGTLYCLEPDGSLNVKLDSVTISNGIVWSTDRRTMYYIDTPTRRVARYRYDDPTGTIRFDGIAVEIPEEYGFPDGMTIDAEGNLWIAHWGGFGVYCWNPQSGELLRRISVPCPNVTSCAFGGEQLDTLYITTAGTAAGSELRRDYPLSGGLFVCKPGVSGVKPLFFSKKN